jgi:hypothetical protein
MARENAAICGLSISKTSGHVHGAEEPVDGDQTHFFETL